MNLICNIRHKQFILFVFFYSILGATFFISAEVVEKEQVTHNSNAEHFNETSESSIDEPIEESAPINELSTKIKAKKESRKIKSINILGNKYVTTEAIASYIPFKVGEVFDSRKDKIIKNIYYGLNRFTNIKVYVENVGEYFINLYIEVTEKKLLKDVIFEGNKQVTDKDIKEKINFSEIPAIDREELKRYAQEIRKIYLDKSYHMVQIASDLEIDGDQAIAIFRITEGAQSTVKRINFTGNKHATSKDLRNILYTREDWILGFMDKAGSYHPDRIDADKHLIEQYYQNHGYLNAKVSDVEVKMNAKNSNIDLMFEIQEGEQFTIGEIKVPVPFGQTIPEAYLLAQLPMRPGDLYSRDALIEALKRLEMVWGNQGYIFAHIDPSVQPDEETKKVNLAFYTELGSKVFLNKITIKGNKKTKDKVIRRKLLLEEGDLLSQFAMDASKDRVESMGYFDQRDGVNWKVTRLSEDKADLDLMLKETKTGRFHVKLGFGGAGADLKNPTAGLSVGAELADTNLFGSGILLNMDANWAKEEQSFNFHLAQPWLFDKPISSAMDLYHKRPSYDEFNYADPIHQKTTGGALTAGVITRNRFVDDTQILFSFGAENVKYENKTKTQRLTQDQINQLLQDNLPVPLSTKLAPGTDQAISYQCILDKEFSPGTFAWLANSIEQDHRNHPIHPSRGHKWKLANKVAFSAMSSTIGFYQFGFDGAWFTPLIGERLLVFKLHGHIGYVTPFGNRTVPYGELFNLGGPASVRGFLFGQIGPKFLVAPDGRGDPIGAKKALFVNAELIFPITPDFNMKGVLFYDGGAGWDNPYTDCIIDKTNLINNNFSYRHAVGFGIRMMSPMPIKIDWGFKLDPRKNKLNPEKSESASEVHFGMTYDW